MVVDTGYMCKKCKKIYHTSERDIPCYCNKCGEDLVKERYWYNLIDHYGCVIETRNSNIFGGHDYVKTILTDNIEKVKIKRKFLFWWELF